MSLYQQIIINLLVKRGKSPQWAKDKTDRLPLGYLQISYLPKEIADKITGEK